MGSCASTKKNSSQQTKPRRKFSVYFPSQTQGAQRYAEQECKQNGLDFKAVQAIFAQSTFNAILDDNYQVNPNSNTDNELPILTELPSLLPQIKPCIISTNKQNEVITFTVPLKKGGSFDENLGKQKNPFSKFDYNSQKEVELEI